MNSLYSVRRAQADKPTPAETLPVYLAGWIGDPPQQFNHVFVKQLQALNRMRPVLALDILQPRRLPDRFGVGNPIAQALHVLAQKKHVMAVLGN